MKRPHDLSSILISQIFLYWPSRPLLNLFHLNYRWTFSLSLISFYFIRVYMWMFSEFQFLIPSQSTQKSSSRRPIYLLTFLPLLSQWWLWCVKCVYIRAGQRRQPSRIVNDDDSCGLFWFIIELFAFVTFWLGGEWNKILLCDENFDMP